MKVHLMLPEDAPKPANLLVLARDALKADLELNVILDNISKGDKFIRNSCLSALMAPLQDLKLLEYRIKEVQPVVTPVNWGPTFRAYPFEVKYWR